jgi:hypothetical protein|tara:strand:- start:371 stop:586 length:216 start_codon:yes stop_codon:yes gene_type:complete
MMVVITDRNGEGALGLLLSDHVSIEVILHLPRRQAERREPTEPLSRCRRAAGTHAPMLRRSRDGAAVLINV